jgi:hypothetical protein
MDDASKAAAAEEHLREIWEALIRERQLVLARAVEGVLAEITDIERGPSACLQEAAQAWQALFKNPRGLSDFNIWRDDKGESIRLNREFEQHVDAVHSLLG